LQMRPAEDIKKEKIEEYKEPLKNNLNKQRDTAIMRA